MKLEILPIPPEKLQEYLDKYEEKIKFILQNNDGASGNLPGTITLIIDVE